MMVPDRLPRKLELSAIAFLEGAGSEQSLFAEAVLEAGGELVQVRGSLLFVSFPSASGCLALLTQLNGRVRGGVSCGDVGRVDGIQQGLPVIEASRLMSEAGPRQILCAERFVRLVRKSDARFGSATPLNLKGIAKPVACCELLA